MQVPGKLRSSEADKAGAVPVRYPGDGAAFCPGVFLHHGLHRLGVLGDYFEDLTLLERVQGFIEQPLIQEATAQLDIKGL